MAGMKQAEALVNIGGGFLSYNLEVVVENLCDEFGVPHLIGDGGRHALEACEAVADALEYLARKYRLRAEEIRLGYSMIDEEGG